MELQKCRKGSHPKLLPHNCMVAVAGWTWFGGKLIKLCDYISCEHGAMSHMYADNVYF